MLLSRTARAAALLILLQAGVAFAMPASRTAAPRFDCGDPGNHLCCVPAPECQSGSFCCQFDGNGNMGNCGCGTIIIQ